MNITVLRLKPLIRELSLLRREVTRLADLYELHLQSTEKITTRIVQASVDDLKQTSVAYTDMDMESMRQMFERQAGRPMTDEEVLSLENLLQDTQE